MHYYQFHIGDYRGATTHLTNEEDITYRRLLDMYYDTEQPIPTDIKFLSRRLRVDCDAVNSVLSDFFRLTELGWVHKVCDKNIAEYHSMAEKNRKNGIKGGRPRTKEETQNNPVGSHSVPSGLPMGCQSEPTGKLTNNHKPRTNNQEPITNKEKEVSPTGSSDKELALEMFNQFYSAYPKRADKAAAKKAWLKINPDLYQKIIDDTKHRSLNHQPWLGDKQYIKGAAAWLNGQRWEDEVIPPTLPKPAFQSRDAARMNSNKDAMSNFAGSQQQPEPQSLLGELAW